MIHIVEWKDEESVDKNKMITLIKAIPFLPKFREVWMKYKNEDWINGTALIWASRNGYGEVVKMLLERNDIDVNQGDRDGDTALLRASWNGRNDIVELLKAHGRK